MEKGNKHYKNNVQQAKLAPGGVFPNYGFCSLTEF